MTSDVDIYWSSLPPACATSSVNASLTLGRCLLAAAAFVLHLPISSTMIIPVRCFTCGKVIGMACD